MLRTNIEQELYRLFDDDPTVSSDKIAAVKKEMQTEIRKKTLHPTISFNDYLRIVFRTYGYRIISYYLGSAFLLIVLMKAVLVYDPLEKYAFMLFVKAAAVLTASGTVIITQRSKRHKMDELELVSCISPERHCILHLIVPVSGSAIVLGTLLAVSSIEKTASVSFLILTIGASYLSALCIMTAVMNLFPKLDIRILSSVICLILCTYHACQRMVFPEMTIELSQMASGIICLVCVGILLNDLRIKMTHLPAMQIQED